MEYQIPDKEVEALKTVINVNSKQKGKGKTLNTIDGGGYSTTGNEDNPETNAHKLSENVYVKRKETNLNILKKTGLDNVTLASDDGKPNKAHKERLTAPIRKPTKMEERTMLGKATEIMIKTGIENHVYRFHNKIRIQKKGGPIGRVAKMRGSS